MSKNTSNHHNNSHQPVLLDEVIRLLAPKSGENYLDLTAGRGGHAQAVMNRVGDASLLVLVDRDSDAVASLGQFASGGAQIIHQDFALATSKLVEKGERFDMILLDLGVSSPQFDTAERGFSIRKPGPLDMRMDQRESSSAQDIVNEYTLEELTTVIKRYGEEPHARQIARVIVENRPFSSTTELADCIEQKLGRRGKIHPATRTFQALRIAVNDELGQLSLALPRLIELLRPNGRLAIISFHSLEDRLVKQFFKDHAEGYEASLKILTKKPILGTNDVFNPRARSAKLRAAVKINT